MELRKVIRAGKSHAVALPKRFRDYMGIAAGDYVELFMADSKTLVIRKHSTTERRHSTDERG